MTMGALDKSAVRDLLKPHGLIIRGVIDSPQIDRDLAIDGGARIRQLLLVGNAGSSIWQPFSDSSEYADTLPHPLDRWSRRIGEQIAGQLGGQAIFPWEGPPYPPFLAWARKSDQVFPSPVSMFIHGSYGLWHAYRFALALPEPLTGFTGFETAAEVSPCLVCADQPCLDACPVEAFSGEDYRVDHCVGYLAARADSECRKQGCAARRACPVGRAFTYQPDHARFHMDAFVKSCLAERM